MKQYTGHVSVDNQGSNVVLYIDVLLSVGLYVNTNHVFHVLPIQNEDIWSEKERWFSCVWTAARNV